MENETNINLEFKTLGMTIEKLSVVYGTFLTIWGLTISLISGSNSFTSFIPSILGILILIFSILAIKFSNKKKLFMHIVVLFGLITFLGGLDFLRAFISGNLFTNKWADVSKFILLTTGLYFTVQCVRSFMHVRKNSSR
tara:strand:+ start:144 stop:560 length:417 start_codon:yes stop_codon:yes gene_type:complete